MKEKKAKDPTKKSIQAQFQNEKQSRSKFKPQKFQNMG